MTLNEKLTHVPLTGALPLGVVCGGTSVAGALFHYDKLNW